MSDHEHQWQDTGFADLEDCAVESCRFTRQMPREIVDHPLYLSPFPGRIEGAPPNRSTKCRQDVDKWATSVYGSMAERGMLENLKGEKVAGLIKQAAVTASIQTSHKWEPLLLEAYYALRNSTPGPMDDDAPITILLRKLRQELDWYNG